jgi:hypothetical protein
VKSTCGPDFVDFALRPLRISEINPRSTIFAVRSEIREIFIKKVHSLRKINKNSPKTSKTHIFPTTTPNPVILVPNS